MVIRSLALAVALVVAAPVMAAPPPGKGATPATPATRAVPASAHQPDCKGATGQARADCAHWENEQRKNANEYGKDYKKDTKDYDKASKEYSKDAKSSSRPDGTRRRRSTSCFATTRRSPSTTRPRTTAQT